MSVLIKGMKKPDNCEVCPYAFCHLDTNNCPIIELPDHGDLIDESERVEAQYYDEEFEEWSIKTKTVGEVLYELCEVPPKVVIPAERSE